MAVAASGGTHDEIGREPFALRISDDALGTRMLHVPPQAGAAWLTRLIVHDPRLAAAFAFDVAVDVFTVTGSANVSWTTTGSATSSFFAFLDSSRASKSTVPPVAFIALTSNWFVAVDVDSNMRGGYEERESATT